MKCFGKKTDCIEDCAFYMKAGSRTGIINYDRLGVRQGSCITTYHHDTCEKYHCHLAAGIREVGKK